MTGSTFDTKHSVEEAVEIQKDFEALVANTMRGVVGIGIALNESKDDLALNVQVKEPANAQSIPKSFEGLDVIVDVVGEMKAF